MAASEDSTKAPQLAPVVDLQGNPFKSTRRRRSRRPDSMRRLHYGAAHEIVEDVIRILSLLEVYAYLDENSKTLDAHAVSAAASTLVEKLREAQKHLREAP